MNQIIMKGTDKKAMTITNIYRISHGRTKYLKIGYRMVFRDFKKRTRKKENYLNMLGIYKTHDGYHHTSTKLLSTYFMLL